MKRGICLAICFLLLFTVGCKGAKVQESEGESTRETTELSKEAQSSVSASENSEQESEDSQEPHESGVAAQEREVSSEESEVASQESEEEIEITNREALNLALDYVYGDSKLTEYSVYCKQVPHSETTTIGYVVVQYNEDGNSYEKYDGNQEAIEKDKTILSYRGLSYGKDYYSFVLNYYICYEDYNRNSILDYIDVSLDGTEIISDRYKEGGYGESLEQQMRQLKETIMAADVQSTSFAGEDDAIAGSYVGQNGESLSISIYTGYGYDLQEWEEVWPNIGTCTYLDFYTEFYKLDERTYYFLPGYYAKSNKENDTWTMTLSDEAGTVIDVFTMTEHYEP